MNKKLKNIFLLAGIIILSLSSLKTYADPGTKNDPLVSKSYLDQELERLKSEIDTLNTPRQSIELVDLKQGQSIIGESGTEIILRAGRATAIVSELGGLSDLTIGRDISIGEEIPKNHLLLIPRTDGRGVFAISDSIYMVRGAYEIR